MAISIKKRTFEIIQVAGEHDTASRVFDLSIIGLILINTALVILDTFSLPVGIKNASSVIEDSTMDKKHFCPYCGKKLD